MAPQNQQRNLLAMLLSGGGGNPYGNQASGPFATSPRIYGRGGAGGGGAPPAGKSQHKGGGGGKARTGGGGNAPAPMRYVTPNVGQPMAGNATSPSSLLQSPEMNATSPSSLLVSPPALPRPNPLQAAVDAAPYTGPNRGAIPYHGPYPGGPTGGPPPMGGMMMPGGPPPFQQPARPFSPTPPPGGLNYDPNSFAGTVQGFERSMGRPSQGQPVPNPQGGGGFLDFLRNAWSGNL
jgi:hypothetical protein